MAHFLTSVGSNDLPNYTHFSYAPASLFNSASITLTSHSVKLVLFLYDQDKNRRQEVPVLLGLVESNHLSVGDQIKLRLFLLAWYMKADQLDAAREQYLNLIHRPGLGRYAETLAGGRL